MKGYIISIGPAVDTEAKDDKDEIFSTGAFVVHGYHQLFLCYFFSSEEVPIVKIYLCIVVSLLSFACLFIFVILFVRGIHAEGH